VRELLRLGRQRAVLARLRLDCGDLVQPGPQRVRLARQLPRPGRTVGQVVGEPAPGPVRLAVPVDQIARAAVPVESRPLFGRLEQPQLVGLPVHGEHALGQLAQEPGRHRAATEVGAGPALDRDRAGHQQVAVLVHLGAGVDRAGEHRRVGRQPQPPVHHRPTGAGPHSGRVGPAAEEQVEPGHDHRLAGTGLAGHHRQAGAELQRDVLDDAEAADTDLGQHAGSVTTPGVRTREPSTGPVSRAAPGRPGSR